MLASESLGRGGGPQCPWGIILRSGTSGREDKYVSERVA